MVLYMYVISTELHNIPYKVSFLEKMLLVLKL